MYYAQRVLLAAIVLTGSAWADSLFNREAEKSGTLISQKVNRFNPGDLITVMVEEKINASTTSDTNTKKEGGVQSQADATANTLLTSAKGLNLLNAEQLPNWDIQTTNETKTRGQTQRKSTLTTEVTCTVKSILPNGNIMLEGDKKMSVNREDSTVHVAGVARSKDITPANTITSSQLANAQVILRGRGPLWNNQRRGLVTRFLDWVSPF